MTADSNNLTVSGHFKNLAKIADFISQAAAQAKLDEGAAYNIQMAVDEACTNIIEHSYGGEGRGQLRLSYSIKADGLQVIIFDQGSPFDPDRVPELDITASLADRTPGGMGLFFMRRLVDTIEFKFDTPQGNQLILFKRREQ